LWSRIPKEPGEKRRQRARHQRLPQTTTRLNTASLLAILVTLLINTTRVSTETTREHGGDEAGPSDEARDQGYGGAIDDFDGEQDERGQDGDGNGEREHEEDDDGEDDDSDRTEPRRSSRRKRRVRVSVKRAFRGGYKFTYKGREIRSERNDWVKANGAYEYRGRKCTYYTENLP